jgi:LPS O-antigen subunit length determinant protein (WzzB/FepE family)
LVGGLTVLFDGNARTFWRSLVTILAIRLLFALLDTAGVFLWRKLYARRTSRENVL